MKKSILILTIIMSIVIVGCSNSSPASNQQSDTEKLEQKIAELEKENAELKGADTVVEDKDTQQEVQKEEDISPIQIGDIIKTDKVEITINNIEFSYDVLPDDTSGLYTHYPAESGNVYIHIDTDVKNLQKQNLNADEIMSVEADYNGGYTYRDNPIPEDSSTGFTYANITSIKPLESLGVRFLINCPQEVEGSDNPLSLVFTVDNQKFGYTIR